MPHEVVFEHIVMASGFDDKLPAKFQGGDTGVLTGAALNELQLPA
jgi:hypothetical protein